MAKLYNRVGEQTTTTGTGTVTLTGDIDESFATFAEAGVQNGDVVTYLITTTGDDFEIGRGTYASAGPTLSRDTVILSKISGTAGTTKITLAGTNEVRITAAAEDYALDHDLSPTLAGHLEGASFTVGTAASPIEDLYLESNGELNWGNDQIRFIADGSSQVIDITGANEVKYFRYSANADGPQTIWHKSRHATPGSHTVLQDGDLVGEFRFEGSDGDQFIRAGLISCRVDGTPGNNDMPGRLEFHLTANGASNTTEWMRLANDGKATFKGNTLELIPTNASSVAYDITSDDNVITSSLVATSGGGGNNYNFYRARNTRASPQIVQDGNQLGIFSFLGYDGDQYVYSAQIGAVVDGTPGDNDMPGRLEFYTTADGASGTTERWRINRLGQFVSAGSDFAHTFSDAPPIVVTNASGGSAGVAISQFTANDDGATLYFEKSRNATRGSHTVINASDVIGGFWFSGSDGDEFVPAAYILGVSDGTPGNNDMPGRLVFATTADAASFPTDRLTIDSKGAFTLGLVNSLATTPSVGMIELDANCLYACTDAGNRGYVPVRHFIRCDSTRTLPNDTAENAIFNSPANGRITLETGTYFFEGIIRVSSMSGTSGNALIDILGAGTATAGSWLWYYSGIDVTDPAPPVAHSAGARVTQDSAASIVTATTGTAMAVRIRGTFEITVAGTVIPSIDLVTAAAAVVSVGSYMSFERIGNTSVASVGQWD